MAIDGIKIIDGDFAWDIHDDFFERFDAGTAPVDIKAALIDEYEEEILSDVDREIFLTTLAECLWSVGQAVDELSEQIQAMFDAGTTAVHWDELYPERKKVLKRFFTKLKKPKTKPMERKKHRVPKKLLFEEGDYLVFTKRNGKQVPVIMWGLEKRGGLTYLFVFPNLTKTEDDTLIQKLLDTTQPITNEELATFFIKGMRAKSVGIEHTNIKAHRDRFHKIGNRPFDDVWYGSSYGSCPDFEIFEKYVNEGGSRSLSQQELEWIVKK